MLLRAWTPVAAPHRTQQTPTRLRCSAEMYPESVIQARPAFGLDRLPRQEAGILGCQKQRDAADLLAGCHPTEDLKRRDARQRLLGVGKRGGPVAHQRR